VNGGLVDLTLTVNEIALILDGLGRLRSSLTGYVEHDYDRRQTQRRDIERLERLTTKLEKEVN